MIFPRVVMMFVVVAEAVEEFDRTDGSLALQVLPVSLDYRIGTLNCLDWFPRFLPDRLLLLEMNFMTQV
jgi:hypothetical protein